MQGSDRKVPHRTECIFTARTVVYAIVCRIIIAERRGVRYVYSSNLQNKKIFIWAERLIMNFPMGEQITITPRNYEFDFRFAGKIKKPLCFDRNGICCRRLSALL